MLTPFDMLSSLVVYNIEILMVWEAKVESSFPRTQFRTQGYVLSSKYERNSHGGAMIVFIREDIPAEIISITLLWVIDI